MPIYLHAINKYCFGEPVVKSWPDNAMRALEMTETRYTATSAGRKADGSRHVWQRRIARRRSDCFRQAKPVISISVSGTGSGAYVADVQK